MKRNELVQIKGLGIKELKDKAKSLTEEMANLVIDKNTNKLKDKKAIFKKRKDLAQILTVLRQKEMLEQLETRVKSQESSEEKTKNVTKEKEKSSP